LSEKSPAQIEVGFDRMLQKKPATCSVAGFNPEYPLEFLFRDQNASKSIALLYLTHSP
jgi:hypothetical protein